MFIRNKSIKALLTSNCCFQLKYKSSITLLSTVKRSSFLNQERNMHRSNTLHDSKQICGWIVMWEDNRGWIFHWIWIMNLHMDYDPLVSKRCHAKFFKICSHEETNSSTSCMAWGCVHFQQIVICGWIIRLIGKSDYFRTIVICFCAL